MRQKAGGSDTLGHEETESEIKEKEKSEAKGREKSDGAINRLDKGRKTHLLRTTLKNLDNNITRALKNEASTLESHKNLCKQTTTGLTHFSLSDSTQQAQWCISFCIITGSAHATLKQKRRVHLKKKDSGDL